MWFLGSVGGGNILLSRRISETMSVQIIVHWCIRLYKLDQLYINDSTYTDGIYTQRFFFVFDPVVKLFQKCGKICDTVLCNIAELIRADFVIFILYIKTAAKTIGNTPCPYCMPCSVYIDEVKQRTF